MGIRHSRGFTMLELLVVMVIAAVLIMIAFAVFGQSTKKAQRASTISTLRMASTSMQERSVDTGFFPAALTMKNNLAYDQPQLDPQVGLLWSDTATAGYTSNTVVFDTNDSNKAGAVIYGRTKDGQVIEMVFGTKGEEADSTIPALAGKVPVMVSKPMISGLPVRGNLLTVAEGGWLSDSHVTYTYQWSRCAINGSGCSAIPGQTLSTYLVASPVDKDVSLKVAVVALNGTGSSAQAISDSLPTQVESAHPASAPSNSLSPFISGAAAEGQTLTANTGNWTAGSTFTYQWFSCDTSGNTCVARGAITAIPTTPLTITDVGTTIRAQVTGTNTDGSVMAQTAATTTVSAAAPVNTVPPAISGNATDGQILTVTQGTWSGSPTITYQWQRCDAGPVCANIPGATGNLYTLVSADFNKLVRVVVTATNSFGPTVANTSPVGPVNGTPPVNVALPTITGTVQDGQSVIGVAGSWNGTALVSYVYQWQQGNSVGGPWIDIAGQNATTYNIPFNTYTGKYLRFKASATNAVGYGNASSVATLITGAPPVSTGAPTLSGTAADNQSLTTSNGTWSGSGVNVYTYQWQSSANGTSGWSAIPAATASTYLIPYGTYTGQYLRAQVTATNPTGNATNPTAASSRVVGAAPLNAVAPTVSGTANDGQTLTSTQGTWTGTPAITYAYQWQFSADGSTGWTNIVGATSTSYVITSAYVGQYVRSSVTGTNSCWSGCSALQAFSTATARITGNSPTNSGAIPSYSGSSTDGSTLTLVSDGVWSGSAPIAFTHQWQYSADGSSGWTNIPAATGSTYTVTSTYVGQYVRLGAIGTNTCWSGCGALSAYSLGQRISGAAPSNSVIPTFSGSANDGSTLTVSSNGTWSGTATITYTYQWQSSATGTSGWSNIAASTASTYAVAPADVNLYIRVQVTGTNSCWSGCGANTASAASSAKVTGNPPTSSLAPAVTGVSQSGSTLTTNNGSWNGTPTITYSYQWQTSPDGSTSWTNIAAATSTSYVLVAGDVGKYIRASVTGTNAQGSVAAASNVRGPILDSTPVNSVIPSLSGAAKVGMNLTTTNGTWSNSPTGYTYQWQSSPDNASWSLIGGATSATYTISSAYDSKYVRAIVTAINSGGSASSTSASSGIIISSVVSISAGAYHYCAAISTGSVKCWGYNTFGQNGTGSNTPVNNLVPVDVVGITNASLVSLGTNFSCALLQDATAKCWGINNLNQLGNGTGTNSSSPVVVAGVSSIQILSAGDGHACALITGGTIKCWGRSFEGELGDGTGSGGATAVTVSGINTAISVSAGSAFTCAVLSGGSVKCWGYNGNSQLGNGGTSNATSPVAVAGISTAQSVIAGYSNACALLVGGAIKCWGKNNDGTFGDGSTTNSLTPVSTLSITNATLVSAAHESNTNKNDICARLSTGVIDCWGDNLYGQIGDGTNTNRLSPTPVSGISTGLQVANSFYAACALIADGTVWCWGSNSNGNFGNGGTTDSKTPVIVSGLPAPPGPPINTALPTVPASIRVGGSPFATTGAWSGTPILTYQWQSSPDNSVWGNVIGANSSTYTPVPAGSTGQYLRVQVTATNPSGATTAASLPSLAVLPPVVAVSAGNRHACALVNDGSVECWGRNYYGSLGNGTNVNSSSPVLVSGISTATAVSVGMDSSCAVLASGTVKCWGEGANGKLGNGGTADSWTPVSVSGISNAIGVAVDGTHACALISGGTVWCWGYNISGELGNASATQSNVPVAVSGVTSVTQISTGTYTSCALIVDHTIRCWGSSSQGQLGNGTSGSYSTTAVTVSGISTAVAINAGDQHTCAVLADGTARCWGSNGFQTNGDQTATSPETTPVVVVGINNAIDISASKGQDTCFLLSTGTVQCLGYNYNGAVGDGTTTARTAPTTVLGSGSAITMSHGTYYGCMILSNGKIRCWGDGGYGTIGDGTFNNALTATYVTGLPDSGSPSINTTAPAMTGTAKAGSLLTTTKGIWSGTPTITYQWQSSPDNSTWSNIGGATSSTYTIANALTGYYIKATVIATTPGGATTASSNASGAVAPVVIQVATGNNHSCALISGGNVKCWGYNLYGELGNGNNTDSATPVAVVGITTAKQIAAYANGVCALLIAGDIKCWGYGPGNTLGNGSTTSTSTPVSVTGITNALAISGGNSNMCALISGGSIKCWGTGMFGALGDGTTNNSSVPVSVVGITTAVSISAGTYSGCVKLADTTARCWGQGTSGQNGDGTTNNSSTPVVVSGLSGAATVVTGSAHGCATFASGSVQCWGSNFGGILGDGTNTTRSAPVSVLGISTATAVDTARGYITCILLSSGVIDCWGDNTNGGLGDGTITARTSPTPVSGVTTATAISIGAYGGCTLLTGGGVQCWGDNGQGQLGNGTTGSYSTTPVTVISLP